MAADSTRLDRESPGPDKAGPVRADAEALANLFALQKKHYLDEPDPSAETRLARLDALMRVIDLGEARLIEAVNADFGNRSRHETLIAEIVMMVSGVRHTKRHLKNWMRPRGAPTPLHMLPARSQLAPQPLGVVGVIAPWNYPVQLALMPAAAALAAGNRVILKPSELTPRTSETMRDLVAKEFDPSVFAVVTGGVELGEAFAATRFDHLVFTGSTAVGRKIAMAAARNLTPVTLELGGKSPAIIDEGADMAAAAQAIAYGKGVNAGQTCIAPDYVLTPHARLDETVRAIADAAGALFPEIDTTPDYTSIISDRHFARLKRLVAEARAAGAEIIEVGSSNALDPQRKLPFTIVVNPPRNVELMREEIFGPVLPVLSVENRAAAIDLVNEGERPLALYWFGGDNNARDEVLRRTVSGGVCVNDTLWHFAQENLPFGGVGESGIGAYHGIAGFERFSHLKPIFIQSKFSSGKMLQPPYTARTDQIIKLVRKII